MLHKYLTSQHKDLTSRHNLTIDGRYMPPYVSSNDVKNKCGHQCTFDVGLR